MPNKKAEQLKSKVELLKSRLTREAWAPLDRLVNIALHDTGQGKRVAGFLLAWWNAEECGGFDPTDLWAVDDEIRADMLAVLAMIAEFKTYPDQLGYAQAFEALVRYWRPSLKGQ